MSRLWPRTGQHGKRGSGDVPRMAANLLLAELEPTSGVAGELGTIRHVMEVAMVGRRSEYPLDVYKLGLGAFVFLSPWLFSLTYGPARIESIISGAAVVLLSLAALVIFADWEEWAMLVIGVWLVVSPWILGFPNAAAMKIHIAAGLVVAFLAGLELWLIHYDDRAKTW